jgi:beta-galactosidase
MVNATVVINNQTVSTHQGGYLPFSAELTGHVSPGENLLSVLVDANCLPVPPMGYGGVAASVDFFQPGGIYRDVRLSFSVLIPGEVSRTVVACEAIRSFPSSNSTCRVPLA